MNKLERILTKEAKEIVGELLKLKEAVFPWLLENGGRMWNTV